MQLAQIIIGTILILSALALIVLVLLQSGKSHNLSGTIAGGAETFFGKNKGGEADKKYAKATTVIAIVFVVLSLASYLLQDNFNEQDYQQQLDGITVETSGETTNETTADSVEG